MVPTAVKRSPRTMEMSCQLFPKGSRTPQEFGHRPLAGWRCGCFAGHLTAKELPWIGTGLELSRAKPTHAVSGSASHLLRCPRTRAEEPISPKLEEEQTLPIGQKANRQTFVPHALSCLLTVQKQSRSRTAVVLDFFSSSLFYLSQFFLLPLRLSERALLWNRPARLLLE